MSRTRFVAGLLALSVVVAGLIVGCSSQTTTSPPVGPANSEPSVSATEEMPEGLSKLSEADRTAALKQRVCPVTGKELGSMGAPPKVVVEGKDVFLCCVGCEEEVRNDPGKYLSKLKAE